MEERRKILPLAWLLMMLLGMALLHVYLPLAQYLNRPWNWAGLVPLVFGVYMAAASARSFRTQGTGLIPFKEATTLVTDGFFRYTRNPMYLGMVLSLLGTSMLLGSLATLLPVPVFAWVIQRNFILGEERFMEEAFGDQYRAYRRRVRRWV